MITITVGCVPEEEILEDVCSVSYMSDLKWLIDGTCNHVGCHSNNSVNGDFTQYAGVKQKVDNGSLWFRVVVTKDMPPGPNLDTASINKIKVWINEGAKDN